MPVQISMSHVISNLQMRMSKNVTDVKQCSKCAQERGIFLGHICKKLCSFSRLDGGAMGTRSSQLTFRGVWFSGALFRSPFTSSFLKYCITIHNKVSIIVGGYKNQGKIEIDFIGTRNIWFDLLRKKSRSSIKWPKHTDKIKKWSSKQN